MKKIKEFFANTKNRFKIWIFFSIIVGIVILVSLMLFFWFGGYVRQFVCSIVLPESPLSDSFTCELNQENASESDLENNNDDDDNIQDSKNDDEIVEDIVENASHSIVGIAVKDSVSNSKVIGTGFIVSKDAYIVTNVHVVGDEKREYLLEISNTDNMIELRQDQIFRDRLNDIAIIQLNKKQLPEKYDYLEFGNSDKLRTGQTVIAIGNPLGEYSSSVTKGIISGLGRDVTIGSGIFGNDNRIYQDVIQTDAAINPGNSGGPLLGLDGKVIGVNFATVSGADNLSFAIPSSKVVGRIEELIKYGKFKIPYIGVEYRTTVVIINEKAMIGALITNIDPDSNAIEAGLQMNDIIVGFDKQNLEEKGLAMRIQESKIDAKVKLDVLRGSELMFIEVVIGEK